MAIRRHDLSTLLLCSRIPRLACLLKCELEEMEDLLWSQHYVGIVPVIYARYVEWPIVPQCQWWLKRRHAV